MPRPCQACGSATCWRHPQRPLTGGPTGGLSWWRDSSSGWRSDSWPRCTVTRLWNGRCGSTSRPRARIRCSDRASVPAHPRGAGRAWAVPSRDGTRTWDESPCDRCRPGAGIARPGRQWPRGSPRGVSQLAAVDRQRVDHQDVDGDDDHAPQRVGLDEEQVQHRAEPGEDDRDGARGDIAGRSRGRADWIPIRSVRAAGGLYRCSRAWSSAVRGLCRGCRGRSHAGSAQLAAVTINA